MFGFPFYHLLNPDCQIAAAQARTGPFHYVFPPLAGPSPHLRWGRRLPSPFPHHQLGRRIRTTCLRRSPTCPSFFHCKEGVHLPAGDQSKGEPALPTRAANFCSPPATWNFGSLMARWDKHFSLTHSPPFILPFQLISVPEVVRRRIPLPFFFPPSECDVSWSNKRLFRSQAKGGNEFSPVIKLFFETFSFFHSFPSRHPFFGRTLGRAP